MEKLTLKAAQKLLEQINIMNNDEKLKTYRFIFLENVINSLELDPTGFHHQELIRLSTQTGHNLIILQAWICYAYLYRMDADMYEKVYQEAVAALSKLEDPEQDLLDMQLNKVQHLAELGKMREAVQLVKKGLQEAKKLNSPWHLFRHYESLTYLTSNPTEKVRYVEEALSYVNERNQPRAYLIAATTFVTTRDFEKALVYLKKLETYALENQDNYKLLISYLHYIPIFATFSIHEPSSQYAVKTKYYFDKAKELCKQFGRENDWAILHFYMGYTFYFERGNYEEAIPYLKEALANGKIQQISRIDTLSALYKSHKALKKYASALKYLEKYTELKEETYSVATQNQINELNAQFQAEKREEEITRLKKENELLEVIKSQKGALEKSHEVITEKNKQLEQVNLTKDRIFAIIGHDLRKPVLSFRGIAKKVDYLLKKGDYKTLRLLGEGIEQDAYGLNKLTDNLLNWALTQRNVMPYQPRELNLHHIAEETIDIFQGMARDKSITLEHHISENLIAYADQNSVLTILRNLIDNAIKYTPSGGSVILKAIEEKEGIIFKIKDTGIGMSADKVKDIFLLQKDKSEKGTAGEKGTGLGMHLVHELVKLNKGDIRVMSQIGQGTTFEVVLPKAA